MKNWRIAFGTLLLFTMNSANAAWQGNWLLGVSTGFADRRGELDIGMLYTSQNPILQRFAKVDTPQRYSVKGALYGLLGGYQVECQGWIWGAEASIDWQDLNRNRGLVYPDLAPNLSSLLSWSAVSKYKRGPIIALTGRMGYEMAPYFIPYLRAGIEGSEESLEVTFTGNPGSITLRKSNHLLHYVVGFGAETPLGCTPVTIRLEYNFESRCKSLESNGLLNDPIFKPFFTVEMHPRTQVGKLSLVWNFD